LESLLRDQRPAGAYKVVRLPRANDTFSQKLSAFRDNGSRQQALQFGRASDIILRARTSAASYGSLEIPHRMYRSSALKSVATLIAIAVALVKPPRPAILRRPLP